MKTAEEFLKSKKYPSYTSDGGYGTVYVTEAMVEFGKLCIENALKEIEIQRCLHHYPRIEFINKEDLISKIK